jgi:putative FmdB family regulatory protein
MVRRVLEVPTYEYKCDNCGQFEVWQRISEPPLKTCPTCGGKAKRLISKNVAILFRAPGFYESDHRSSEYKKKESEDRTGVKVSGPSSVNESSPATSPSTAS